MRGEQIQIHHIHAFCEAVKWKTLKLLSPLLPNSITPVSTKRYSRGRATRLRKSLQKSESMG